MFYYSCLELDLKMLHLFVLRGPPRRPPPQVQDQVKSLNQSLRLGHLLCRSRNPDFLLNIIQRQVKSRRQQREQGAYTSCFIYKENDRGMCWQLQKWPRMDELSWKSSSLPYIIWNNYWYCYYIMFSIFWQASSQSMPWLADLVQSSEGSLDVLPVQCLCEFLLHDAADDSQPIEDEDEGESKEQRAKKRQVLWPTISMSSKQ